MSKNYNELFKREINKLDYRPSLLLHVCCGPCSEYPLVLLNKYFDITIYYENPNIFPYAEYEKRLNELEKYLNILNADIKLIVPKYNFDFQKDLAKFPIMAEGKQRCVYCYARRMLEGYKYASKNRFDYFTTVMSISNHKNANYINCIGELLNNKYPNTKFLYADFKKDGGIDINRQMNKEINLYNQDYCGCVFTYKIHESKLKESLNN